MDDTTVPGKRQSLSTATLYAQSKLVCLFILPQEQRFSLDFCGTESSLQGNIILAKEIARRYADRGIVSLSLNPGTPPPVLLSYNVLNRCR